MAMSSADYMWMTCQYGFSAIVKTSPRRGQLTGVTAGIGRGQTQAWRSTRVRGHLSKLMAVLGMPVFKRHAEGDGGASARRPRRRHDETKRLKVTREDPRWV